MRVILGSIEVTPISIADVESFHACLDAVAREQRYLALMEAPPLRELESFVAQNMAHQVPQVVAKDGNVVVGWCDISPGLHQTLQHCGTLGMGVLGGYRGRGIGRRLLRACVGLAKDGGMTRVELEVRADNLAAIALYQSVGFEHEGTKKRGMRVSGEYQDTIAMALLL